jgi:hypothetical protein
VELKEDAFAAFADEEAVAAAAVAMTTAVPAKEGQQDAQQTPQERQRDQARGPASKRADKLRGEAGTPKRAREAINLGLQRFQERQYAAAIDLFQLALEVGPSAWSAPATQRCWRRLHNRKA